MIMLLFLHISAALAGIIASTYGLFSPSRHKIAIAIGLVGLTVISGTAIIIQRHLAILPGCVSGLFYVGFNLILLAAAKRRLAH